MGKKFRRKRRKNKPEKIFNIPVAREMKKVETHQVSATIILTPEDQIIYIYECDKNNKTTEVVNVSYQILIEDRWITIIRFDSEHGYLHCHQRISLNSEGEIVFTRNYLPKKGGPHRWLTWSIQHLKKNYLVYKKSFLEKKADIDNKTKY